MGDISYKRFLFLGSVGPSAFIENRKDSSQISYINHPRRNGAHEV